MKIIETTTMTNIIEDCFGEFDTDAIRIPKDLKAFVGVVLVSPEYDKVEHVHYDRRYEWIPWVTEDEDD